MVGITGVPGAGKSTLTEMLASQLDEETYVVRVVPMDGFHWPNDVLRRKRLASRKGAPSTFDVDGFLECLANIRLRKDRVYQCPAYSRVTHEPIANAITIGPEARLVLVEGNYLLLDDEPWRKVRCLLDEVWFLHVPIENAMKRVAARHLQKGITPQEAEQKIRSTDRPNAVLVQSTSRNATKIVKLRSETFDDEGEEAATAVSGSGG